MLFWSMMVFTSNVPVIMVLEKIPFNFSFAIAFLYIFYYILLEPIAGVNDHFLDDRLLIFLGCLCSFYPHLDIFSQRLCSKVFV